jgi:hypothetical protein
MRGPKAVTGIASSSASTFIMASWWHSSQVTGSKRRARGESHSRRRR